MSQNKRKAASQQRKPFWQRFAFPILIVCMFSFVAGVVFFSSRSTEQGVPVTRQSTLAPTADRLKAVFTTSAHANPIDNSSPVVKALVNALTDPSLDMR